MKNRDGSQTAKAFRYIKSEIEAGRPFPQGFKIAEHMGWQSESGISDVMTRLCRWGWLKRRPGNRQGYDITI